LKRLAEGDCLRLTAEATSQKELDGKLLETLRDQVAQQEKDATAKEQDLGL